MISNATLALENEMVFDGLAIGAFGEAIGEVVFNTAMTGYQEILSDPSYARQIVTLTHPHIGNTGFTLEDEESSKVWSEGLIIRDLPLMASSWREQESLSNYLKRHHIIGIAEIDTRRLTRVLRKNGALNGCVIASSELSDMHRAEAIMKAKSFPGLKGMDLAEKVSVKKTYEWGEGTWRLGKGYPSLGVSRFHVVAYDFGVKKNILRMLVDRGCRVTVVPAKTSAKEVLSLDPDGVFLSNGPGDPDPCKYAISAITKILETKTPIFGICLGLQLLALSAGMSTKKMGHGHHGANHPVKDLVNGTVMITSQNHGFCIDDKALPDNVVVTHRSLFDKSLQGIHLSDYPAFGFQGHPEASPGPHDAGSLFDHFVELMSRQKHA
ncbi:MAG: glutamine-hydrolyzing carbamoyl-phosphate synthase small subunit [Candidatus Azotimanducaceae bacterium]|uniref:Carbamoyl phosphate synthase small chain n=1 Tax=OM182 bacterium TaxID=2510334 RepID=A0A520S1W5_9GAMM|nr:carbamoyl-phosphate synthase small subunit [Gammaproteobacteria bacterium]OUV68580.1 MAG: carbamoyl-phosphate synthase small subunit [Gammaproteobacteria bacterium TMED133]RZO76421.1 MAG: carbamoyl-phosphate synthase small subunit [OM182 bacterium]